MKAITFNPSIPRFAIGRTIGHIKPEILWSCVSCTRYLDILEPSLPSGDWVKIKSHLGGIRGTDLSTIRLHISLSLTLSAPFLMFLDTKGLDTYPS